MKTKLIARLVSAATFALGAGAASAAGFQLLEQNASGIGNAYAGSAAVADNASTIYFNPAGMTRLQDREFSLGLSLVRPSFKFTDSGSTNPLAFGGGPASGSDGGDAGGWAFIPNAYLSWALNKDLYVGVGMGAPFGLVTEYDSDWVGRYHSKKFDIKTININPSVAYRVNDRFSIGAGVSVQRFEAEYVRQAHPTLGNVTFKADDTSMGWNIGALWQVSPAMKLGASYRAKIKHELDGDLKTAVPGASGAATAEIELPDTLILSVTHQLDDRWEMLGDVSWTGWSSIDDVAIKYKGSGSTAQTLEANFRDTWRIALGANYKYSDMLKLRFGIAYDQTPVRSAEDRLVSLPDANRTWLSTGFQYKIDNASNLDVGLSYLLVGGTTINNDDGVTRGTVSGSYDSNVFLLGAQYSRAF